MVAGFESNLLEAPAFRHGAGAEFKLVSGCQSSIALLAEVPAPSVDPFEREREYGKPFLIKFLSESAKIELTDDGRPAPAALRGDCCGL